MLCEFTLPSNPEIVIKLREATVADAIEFSTIDPEMEELATTNFLERVQETKTNPREWTGEDRRYALFQYYLYTNKSETLTLTFNCSECGEKHTSDIPLSAINDTYTPINGKPFREFPFNGHNVVIRPLNGEDLENIEKYRYDLLLTEKESEKKMPTDRKIALDREIRTKQMHLAMYRVLCCIDMPFLDEDAKRPADRRSKVEEFVKRLPANEFRVLINHMEEALKEMRHGLQSIYSDGRIYLEIPGVPCDNYPEGGKVTLHYPFRAWSIIPTL